ncbi:MAG: hypothetical protein BMS9Abin17_1592 [Acidimicrobiia bacterium]|nr:MAG: hypothetical protein BMS9Abin17_1592 [Acidimicrobiia bacterium]
MDTNALHYLPVISTAVAAAFAVALYRKWNEKRSARYLMWWMIGIVLYGIGTLAESLTTVFGWSEPVFRLWYVSGALLGGAPLATGTVYLLLSKKTADRIAIALITYISIAAVLVLVTPLALEFVEPNRLSGEVIGWRWVRLLSPLVNLYAVVFLIGGAIWSAWSYWRKGDASSRVLGNILIAVGAILPGIGGGFARAGIVEVLYVGELIGLILIWSGFVVITKDDVRSIYESQRASRPPLTSSPQST